MAGAPEYGPEKTPYFTMVLTCCAGCEDCTIRMRSCAAAENRLKRAEAALDSQEAYRRDIFESSPRGPNPGKNKARIRKQETRWKENQVS